MTYLSSLGCIILQPWGFNLFAGIVVIIVGLLYLLFQFVPAIVPPAASGWLRRQKAHDSNQHLPTTNSSTAVATS
jgi:hypothetical protein